MSANILCYTKIMSKHEYELAKLATENEIHPVILSATENEKGKMKVVMQKISKTLKKTKIGNNTLLNV